MDAPITPLKYLMRELGINAPEWSKLDQKDKDDLKAWAADEIALIAAK